LFFVSDLKKDDDPKTYWFSENSRRGLAGRCLLDVLEYLYAVPNVPRRFWHVTNAHTIRLACHCLSDADLKQTHVLDRMQRQIQATCRQLQRNHNDDFPRYGDDFWDWASVIEAFAEVQAHFPNIIDDDMLMQELEPFYECVKARLTQGLTIPGSDGEWYGPATAAVAFRVLTRLNDCLDDKVDDVLKNLREQALERVEDGKYRGRDVPPYQILWHYGQVLAEFQQKDSEQAQQIADLSCLETIEKSDRVYALARVLQGARAIEDEVTVQAALAELYDCQNLKRPLGQGLMGDNVKGSLNLLEALWPMLSPKHKENIGSMIDGMLREHAKANTVGILVAIKCEREAVLEAFNFPKARVTPSDEPTVIEYDKYRVVVCQGKSLTDATLATAALIGKHKAKWVIMAGIAGSLRAPVATQGEGVQFLGPNKGDVVIAASIAPFRIREKVRKEIENAKVPFAGSTWMTIPTDPWLFRLAHKAADKMAKNLKVFYEGLIVTGNGILDSEQIRKDALVEFPGGLAVEEEGYPMALVCMADNVPYLVIRGISDLVGQKAAQQEIPGQEKKEQAAAAQAAARLTVEVVQLLSQQW